MIWIVTYILSVVIAFFVIYAMDSLDYYREHYRGLADRIGPDNPPRSLSDNIGGMVGVSIFWPVFLIFWPLTIAIGALVRTIEKWAWNKVYKEERK